MHDWESKSTIHIDIDGILGNKRAKQAKNQDRLDVEMYKFIKSVLLRLLRGPGGVFIWPIMEIDFIVFSDRGEWDLPAAFYLIKKFLS